MVLRMVVFMIVLIICVAKQQTKSSGSTSTTAIDRREAAGLCFKVFDFNNDEILQPQELAIAYAFNFQGKMTPLEVTASQLEEFLTSISKGIPSSIKVDPTSLTMPKDVFIFMFVEGNLKDASDEQFVDFMNIFSKYAKEEIPKVMKELEVRAHQ